VVIGRRLLLLSAVAATSGCGLWRPTPVPMRTVWLPSPCAGRAETLLVFLPGSYSRPEDFVEHGFIDALRREGIVADMVLVDAHLGYYSERSILDRLENDVFDRARAAGYGRIWLVGISIGAFGALLQAAKASAPRYQPDGIVAIAPYLGERRLSEQIAGAGGLTRWSPPGAPEGDELVWAWLQAAVNRAPEPRLYLAYGESDRFAFSDGLLAAVLPSTQVFTRPGGHDWATWRALWQQMLPLLPLRADGAPCSSSASGFSGPRTPEPAWRTRWPAAPVSG
jgi:hypothetical protein